MQDAHMIELNFERGRFVSSKGSINYQEVLDDFPNAKMIRIITYNISKSQHFDALMDAIVNTKADVQMITNIPSRMAQYYNSPRGNSMRSAARENIHIYVSKLNSDKTIGIFNEI